MIWTFILFASSIICWIHLKSKDIHVLSEKVLFSDKLNTLCPHSSFCNLDADSIERHILTENNEKRGKPCCSSCSCLRDCGRKRNCCTSDLDVYKLDESLDTICKQLQPHADSEFYHIVDKCPNTSQMFHLARSSTKDNFRPVYSNENGMIYYNMECSKCHGQTNITNFLPVATCQQAHISYFSVIKGLKANQINDECTLNFIQPDNIDLSTELCYPLKINSCNKKINYSTEFEQLCHSFNATFIAKHYSYSNVFCFLCNAVKEFPPSEWKKKYEYCPALEVQKLISDVPLSVVLDDSIGPSDDIVDRTEFKLPERCLKTGNKTTCRTLLCPEGQDYLNGECNHVATKWYFKQLKMVINLTTTTEVHDFTRLELERCANENSLVLERPGFEDWDYTLFFNFGNDDKTIRYIVAVLTYRFKTVLPKPLIHKAQKSLSLYWALYMNQTAISIKPVFNNFIRYVDTPKLGELMIVPELYLYETEPSYIKLLKDSINYYSIKFLIGDKQALDKKKGKETIYLTKLFFCNTFEMVEPEFIAGSFTTYLDDNGKILGDGEFTWVVNETGGENIRICAYDMGETVFSNGRVIHSFIMNVVLSFSLYYVFHSSFNT